MPVAALAAFGPPLLVTPALGCAQPEVKLPRQRQGPLAATEVRAALRTALVQLLKKGRRPMKQPPPAPVDGSTVVRARLAKAAAVRSRKPAGEPEARPPLEADQGVPKLGP